MYLLPELVMKLKGDTPTKEVPKPEAQADLEKMANRPSVPSPAQSLNNNNNAKEREEDINPHSSEPKSTEPKSHSTTRVPMQATSRPAKSPTKSKNVQQIGGQGSLAQFGFTKKRKRDADEADSKEADPDHDADPTERQQNKRQKKQ